MKKWILWVFSINKDLDNLYEGLEKKIHSLSLNYTLAAVKLYDRVIDLNKKKNRIVNLRVLYNIMSDALTSEEKEFLELSLKLKKHLNSELKEKRGEVGKLNRVVSICQNAMVRAGYGTKRLKDDYGSFFINKLAS